MVGGSGWRKGEEEWAEVARGSHSSSSSSSLEGDSLGLGEASGRERR